MVFLNVRGVSPAADGYVTLMNDNSENLPDDDGFVKWYLAGEKMGGDGM